MNESIINSVGMEKYVYLKYTVNESNIFENRQLKIKKNDDKISKGLLNKKTIKIIGEGSYEISNLIRNPISKQSLFQRPIVFPD